MNKKKKLRPIYFKHNKILHILIKINNEFNDFTSISDRISPVLTVIIYLEITVPIHIRIRATK